MKKTFTLFVLIFCLAASAHGQQQTKVKVNVVCGGTGDDKTDLCMELEMAVRTSPRYIRTDPLHATWRLRLISEPDDCGQTPRSAHAVVVVGEMGGGMEQFGNTALYFTTKDNVQAQAQKILSDFDQYLRDVEKWR